jgi:UrcA family protein
VITDDNYSRLPTLAALALTLLVCATQCAEATNSFSNPPQRVVTLADLDLTHSLDIEKLHRRISNAAREVCWTPGVVATLRRNRMHQCTRETIAHSVATLNLPQLTAHHQKKLDATGLAHGVR